MTSEKQKSRERAILERYQAAITLEGDISSGECPDFIITRSKNKVGVEITEYHQPRHSRDSFSRTTVEAEWRKIRALVVEYRESNADLNGLSVYLSFKKLEIPGRAERLQFIKAVHDEIKHVRHKLTKKSLSIKITEKHPQVLSKYLSSVKVRIVNCYLEWDWNHMVASVGTSDDELSEIIYSKRGLSYDVSVDELHLVIAGDGASGGSYIGYLHIDILNRWQQLEATLTNSKFEVVAVFNYDESFIWRRTRGWSKISYIQTGL